MSLKDYTDAQLLHELLNRHEPQKALPARHLVGDWLSTIFQFNGVEDQEKWIQIDFHTTNLKDLAAIVNGEEKKR